MNAATPLLLLIRAYRLLISPLMGRHCRFEPSCSEYALEALQNHGAVKGSWLALRRLACCHPWHRSGYDPVPSRYSAPDATPACSRHQHFHH